MNHIRAHAWVRVGLSMIIPFILGGCGTTQPTTPAITSGLRSAISGMLIPPNEVLLAEPFELEFRVEATILRPQTTLTITLPPEIELVSGSLHKTVDLAPDQPYTHRVMLRIPTLGQLAQIQAQARWSKFDSTGKLIEGDGANDQLFLRVRTAQAIEFAHTLFPEMRTPIPQTNMSVPSDSTIPQRQPLTPTVVVEPTPYRGSIPTAVTQ